MSRNTRIPDYLSRHLHREMNIPVPPPAQILPGTLLPAVRERLRGAEIGSLSSQLLSACDEGRCFSIKTDGSPDALCAAGILGSLLEKLGAERRREGQQELFDAASEGAEIEISIGGGGIRACGERASSGGLSLSALALLAVGAIAGRGGLAFADEVVVFDLETTGRDAESDEIIEIGAVKTRGGVETDIFSELVRPSGAIPAEVEELTGISNSDVRSAPPARDVLPRFLAFCGDTTLVAHNAPFDVAFLKRQSMTALGRDVGNDWEDTLVMSRWLHPGAPSHRLGDIAALLGIRADGWHRAVADARMAARLYERLRHIPRDVLTELRMRQFLPLAALGTVLSGTPLVGENGLIVAQGTAAMVREYSLPEAGSCPAPREPVEAVRIPQALVSLHDAVRRRAALTLLRGRVGEPA